jgi:hypothetical protein
MNDRDREIQKSLTREQMEFICYQIGDWYLMMKPLLEGQHNLGHMKEKLKTMICGEVCYHESDGLIYCSNPPQNKCIKCGDFYR